MRYTEFMAMAKNAEQTAKELEDKLTRRIIENGEGEAVGDRIERCRLLSRVYRSNALVTLWEDNKQAIYEALKPYNGKHIGEKTSDKIKAKLRDESGIYVYFADRSYRTEVHISKVGDYCANGVETSTPYNQKLIDDDNVLRIENFEKLELLNLRFIDDPETYVDEVKKSFELVKKTVEEAREAVSAFNKQAFALNPSNTIYIPMIYDRVLNYIR